MDGKHDVLIDAADVAKGYGITVKDLLRGVGEGTYPEPDDHDMAGNPQWLFSTLIAFLDERERICKKA